jgi:hypothetical protein
MAGRIAKKAGNDEIHPIYEVFCSAGQPEQVTVRK